MGVDHGGNRGDKSPQNLERGDTNANCSPRFCHIGTKISVLWPSKYAKIRLAYYVYVWRIMFGVVSSPVGGAHDAPRDPLVGWRGDTPPHTSPHSAPTHLRRSPCVPPEVQPDLRLCFSQLFPMLFWSSSLHRRLAVIISCSIESIHRSLLVCSLKRCDVTTVLRQFQESFNRVEEDAAISFTILNI